MQKLKSVYIKTMGCQMNEHDSAKIADLLLQSHGISSTNVPEEADLLILNTCAIREKATEKVFSELGRWRILKQERHDLVIAVGGCVASTVGSNILTRAPFVNVVFGPQTMHKLPMLIQLAITQGKSQTDLSWEPIEKFDNLPRPRVTSLSAYLAVIEGCNKYCSYCVVPYTRGKEVSRDFKQVLLEASQLAAQGVKEITLLGQNVNAYKSFKPNGTPVDLAVLLQYLAEIPGIERLSFMTSHPKELNDNLIQVFKLIPKLANHLHLPVQSGSDKILRQMKRGYTVAEYIAKVNKLREIRSDLSISSDFIVGFPGETKADFNATLELIEQIGFDNSYSFIYSKRPGTPAENYPDNVAMEEKRQRLKTLQTVILRHSHNIGEAMIGSTQAVIVLNRSKKNPTWLIARTANNRLVKFVGEDNLIGKVVKTKITQNLTNTLVGDLI